MRSSEDSANHEFVFMGNKEPAAQSYNEGPAPVFVTPRRRSHPRLNQPIPTSLDQMYTSTTSVPRTWPTFSSATTTRAKATPLPPELIELLPPHLRENTVPDFTTSATPPVEEHLPERPPLPTAYCFGDYSNLDDPSTPTTPHNYDYLSDLVTSNALDVLTSSHSHTQGTRAPLVRTSTNSSNTAPAALLITGCDLNSGGRSISVRSNSSRSLPQEGSKICHSQRPFQPPSPKFARTPCSSNSGITTTVSTARVSNSAVLVDDGEWATMVRSLDSLSPTQSPLPNNFRADSSQRVNSFHRDFTNIENLPYTCYADASPSVNQYKPNPVAHQAPTATPLSMTAKQPAMLEKKSRVSQNTHSISTVLDDAFDPSITTRCLSSSHSPTSRTHRGQASARVQGVVSPSTRDTRQAWNTVGVPVSEMGQPASRSPSPSLGVRPVSQAAVRHSDPDSIYDNLMVRYSPMAAATSRTTPTANILPATIPHPLPNTSYRLQTTPSTPTRRVIHSPLIGKPPSPPTQRRASRSPTHSSGWKPPDRLGSPHYCPDRPGSPHYCPDYPTLNPHYGGCWVPMWGSSPQLCQAGGTHVFPAYIHNGLPGRLIHEGRSHSCDRLPARQSPPPSHLNGRRSASPWRGGSASPVGHRQSPSPECSNGRPPRPRRPPHRKSKTVEVGFLGLAVHPSSTTGITGVVQTDSTTMPLQPRAHLPSPPTSRIPPARQLCMQAVDYHDIPTNDTHIHARQQLNLYTNIIPEQNHKLGDECENSSVKSSSSPAPPTFAAYGSSPSPVFGKQEQAEASKHKGGSLEDRVIRLEGDKDSLQLQVTVLSEQVEAQTEKILDLENLLEQKKEQLQKTEEQLQKELMTRSSLETQRLELFSEISNLKLHQTAYERENIDLREKIRRSDQQSDHVKAQLAAQLTNYSSPSSISTLSTIPASSPNKSPTQPITATPASSPVSPHEAKFMPPRTPPPNARRKIDQFGTVPRQREAGVYGENNHGTSAAGRAKGVMFAETEMQMIDDLPEGEYYQQGDGAITSISSSPRSNTLTGHRSPPTHHKATGIKKIFTRLRRSSSGHLDSDLGEGDFRRGGMRATASARLGWTSPSTAFNEPSAGFVGWNIETMEAWLGALGLNQYCSAVRAWSSSGHHLSRATPQQLERELGIRHPLHRKKLQLAVAARLSGDQLNTPLARLDHSWVLRWLDDVGLPQYKDAFSEARIDGRVLNCLTYDDLSFLRLSNLLHVTSLKRGIQVLREHNFDPSVLKRRSVPDEGQRTRTAAEVALWTNHRVMEWLRTVDLSEYAPNLRGSGVHGALMVYEVRFTSELLASLLSIPCGKTLLRRHLNTHFKELVGRSVVQEKRELEAASGYTPLSTSAKVKMPKKSQFSLKRKKSKSDLEFDDLLCPLDEKPPVGAMQDKKREVRTGEVEEINSLMIEEEVKKKLGTQVAEEHLQRASGRPMIGRITYSWESPPDVGPHPLVSDLPAVPNSAY
ncbi:uncharacterized protein LOC121855582 isoform X4 [Homarus americanus]|uniref:uncharacterized protein LOC121855582 isoform X4 n=1 Tax=Homarus americanus TaxID=6706 RepID=UPI001C48C6BA|nr:uncharacterized protein LOC121855582 isoform X4 [Homarus americanus]